MKVKELWIVKAFRDQSHLIFRIWIFASGFSHLDFRIWIFDSGSHHFLE